MPNKFTVKSRYLSTFESVEMSPDARIDSDGSRMKIMYPSEATTREYIVSEYPVEDDTVELPQDSVVAEVTGSKLIVLVPESAYE